ncbi:ABC transporter ATP-binding protein [Sciscionella marina]|uniref:ABC transporter ATP-binding protein n=1 Tax=Sciscionella marina TaxID=508770 RepID=UPI00037F01CB|nr:oligopeptide/dipeptide ABC transporter ATP-binding protein [Sciscionella marina]
MTAPVLDIRDLVKEFPLRGKAGPKQTVHAVSGIDLTVRRGQTLGLVGESGCGKSTLARCAVRLTEPSSGTVELGGADLFAMKGRALRAARRQLQMVFQDPFTTLDPTMTIGGILREPLEIHGMHRRRRDEYVRELLDRVGLDPGHAHRYPHEFSGGQRQRVGLARALAVEPSVLVLDEPLSALDISVQSGVLNLLEDLQEEFDLGYLLIAHDLSVVRHTSTEVAVMYLGRIVERGPVDAVYDGALHPYTQALLSAVPVPDPRAERRRERIVLTGDVPQATDPPSGCRFRTRCRLATEICASTVPELVEHDSGHRVACHHPRTISS